MKHVSCKCGRIIRVNDDCIEVMCPYCCHNAVAEQLKEEESKPVDNSKPRKKLKKYFCNKYKVKKSKTTIKCKGCDKKSGCELWSMRNKK